MDITTPLSDRLSRYLDLASAQLKVTASNMANIDTPGYRALGMDFNAEMHRAMVEASADRLTEMQTGLPGAEHLAPRITEVDGLIERPDGNDVSMDHEGLTLAEAQLKFRTGVELIKREYTRVMDAIHADAK